MAEDAGEKTEAPTQRRRDDARQKGDRLQSRELATALGGIAGALWLWAFAPGMARGLREATAAALHPARSADGFERAAADIAGAVMAFVWPILPPLAALWPSTTHESFSASGRSGSEYRRTRGAWAEPVTCPPARTEMLGRMARMSSAGLSYGPFKRTRPLSTSSAWPQAR